MIAKATLKQNMTGKTVAAPDKIRKPVCRCKKCSKLKPLAFFVRSSNSKAGYLKTCKLCHNQENSRWRSKNREYLRQWQKNYRKGMEQPRKGSAPQRELFQ